MKIRVEGLPSLGSHVFAGDVVTYRCDGDGDLYITVEDASGARTSGALFARGCWGIVFELEQPPADLAETVRKRQHKAAAG